MKHLGKILLTIFSSCGSFLIQALGGWDKQLQTLIIFMVIDFITGLIVALVFHKSGKTQTGAGSSLACFLGIVKKVCMLLLIIIAQQVDNLMNLDFTRTTLVLFLIANEGLSILENFGLMGFDKIMPEFLKNALEVLKDKSGRGGTNES